jgi:hypothetical protein
MKAKQFKNELIKIMLNLDPTDLVFGLRCDVSDEGILNRIEQCLRDRVASGRSTQYFYVPGTKEAKKLDAWYQKNLDENHFADLPDLPKHFSYGTVIDGRHLPVFYKKTEAFIVTAGKNSYRIMMSCDDGIQCGIPGVPLFPGIEEALVSFLSKNSEK